MLINANTGKGLLKISLEARVGGIKFDEFGPVLNVKIKLLIGCLKLRKLLKITS
jgi:hypothetical protein